MLVKAKKLKTEQNNKTGWKKKKEYSQKVMLKFKI